MLSKILMKKIESKVDKKLIEKIHEKTKRKKYDIGEGEKIIDCLAVEKNGYLYLLNTRNFGIDPHYGDSWGISTNIEGIKGERVASDPNPYEKWQLIKVHKANVPSELIEEVK